MTELKSVVNNFYKDLFSEDDLEVPWHQSHYTFPRIEQPLLDALGQEFSAEEVKEAGFGLDSWKAPGLDGFPAGFFQNSWEIVSQNLADFAKQVWLNPVSISDINYTDICLIPKIPNPELVSQFRPISLCIATYKFLTK